MNGNACSAQHDVFLQRKPHTLIKKNQSTCWLCHEWRRANDIVAQVGKAPLVVEICASAVARRTK